MTDGEVCRNGRGKDKKQNDEYTPLQKSPDIYVFFRTKFWSEKKSKFCGKVTQISQDLCKNVGYFEQEFVRTRDERGTGSKL